jgi:AcrR family transcriptional regulator
VSGFIVPKYQSLSVRQVFVTAVETPSRTAKGDRTRAALVTAAVRRFAVDGFQRASVSDVARDVGLTPAAVYRYFPDKEALFLAAVDEEANAVIRVVADAFGGTGKRYRSVHALLTAAMNATRESLREHPLLVHVLAGGEPMPPGRLNSLLELTAMRERLGQLLALGQTVGLVRTDVDPATMALGCETIFIYQLAHLAILHRADEAAGLDANRWKAVTAMVEAAIRPPKVAS